MQAQVPQERPALASLARTLRGSPVHAMTELSTLHPGWGPQDRAAAGAASCPRRPCVQRPACSLSSVTPSPSPCSLAVLGNHAFLHQAPRHPLPFPPPTGSLLLTHPSSLVPLAYAPPAGCWPQLATSTASGHPPPGPWGPSPLPIRHLLSRGLSSHPHCCPCHKLAPPLRHPSDGQDLRPTDAPRGLYSPRNMG